MKVASLSSGGTPGTATAAPEPVPRVGQTSTPAGVPPPVRVERWRYVGLCFLVIFIVDWGTAGGFHPSYFAPYELKAPVLVLFFWGMSLMFSYFAINRGWAGRNLLAAAAAVGILFEGLLFGNPLILTFPLLLLGLPLAICIYSALAFLPLWTLKRELRARWRPATFLVVVPALVTLLSAATRWW